MITHRRARTARSASRAAALALVPAAVLAGAPAFADTPSNWATAPHVSGLDFLLVLLLIPLGVALIIALLVSLPSMIKGNSYEAGDSWRSEDEWFGGPRKGISAGTHTNDTKDEGMGGASASW